MVKFLNTTKRIFYHDRVVDGKTTLNGGLTMQKIKTILIANQKPVLTNYSMIKIIMTANTLTRVFKFFI